MENILEGLLSLAFSGIPSNAVYDGVKAIWAAAASKTWEELLTETFREVICEE